MAASRTGLLPLLTGTSSSVSARRSELASGTRGQDSHEQAHVHPANEEREMRMLDQKYPLEVLPHE